MASCASRWLCGRRSDSGAEEFVRPAAAGNAASFEDDDLVRERDDFGRLVRDVEDRQGKGRLDLQEVLENPLLERTVEAGERLGFLPGDMLAKVDPYLRPLFDALYDMLDAERLNTYMERGTIEVAPLAFMRGRTLNDSFIILDEAQNTSPEQMQMFLTRLGFGSKMVVTGDVTQIDLPREQASGLIQVQDILRTIDGIEFIQFGHEDVVRHKLVQRIVEAYKLHAEETGTGRHT